MSSENRIRTEHFYTCCCRHAQQRSIWERSRRVPHASAWHLPSGSIRCHSELLADQCACPPLLWLPQHLPARLWNVTSLRSGWQADFCVSLVPRHEQRGCRVVAPHLCGSATEQRHKLLVSNTYWFRPVTKQEARAVLSCWSQTAVPFGTAEEHFCGVCEFMVISRQFLQARLAKACPVSGLASEFCAWLCASCLAGCAAGGSSPGCPWGGRGGRGWGRKLHEACAGGNGTVWGGGGGVSTCLSGADIGHSGHPSSLSPHLPPPPPPLFICSRISCELRSLTCLRWCTIVICVLRNNFPDWCYTCLEYY